MSNHTQIKVVYPLSHYPDYEVEIDKRMLPVVTALWKRKITTEGCCEGEFTGINAGAYLAFDVERHFWWFARLLDRYHIPLLSVWTCGRTYKAWMLRFPKAAIPQLVSILRSSKTNAKLVKDRWD